MREFLEMAAVYAQNPASFLIFLIALVITIVLVGILAISVAAFVLAMLCNIVSLYLRPQREDLSGFHPYTQSILSNSCPELERIRRLKAMPQSGFVRSELQKTAQRMIDILEECEPDEVRSAIIRKLKAI